MDKFILKGGGGGSSIDAEVMEYKGGWAANTNTPTLSNSDTDVHGNIYIVTDDGSTDFGAGAISFEAGDFVVNNGTIWEKVDSTKTAAQIKTAYESNSDTNAFTDSEQSKLSGIESNATQDQSGAEIKSLYEAQSNTNAFTDAEQSKLSGIESGAEVNDVNSVNSQTGAVSLDADDIDDTSTTHKFATASQLSKIDGVEAGATADQSDSEIKTAYENNANTNAYTDSEKTKVGNVPSDTNAELSGKADTSHTHTESDITDLGNYFDKTLDNTDDITESATNLFLSSSDKSKLDNIESNATADQTDAEIKTAYENNANTNAYTDAEKSKVANVPNDTNSELSGKSDTGHTHTESDITDLGDYLDKTTDNLDDVNAGTTNKHFTASDESKLDGIESGATQDQSDAEIKTAIDNELTGVTVGTSDTQTLTNKTIDADSNTISNIDNNEIKASAGISFSKLETVGTDHIVGRTASGSGVVTGLTATQVRSILNVENGATADQSDAEIETAYNNQVDIVTQTEAEAGTDTNVHRWTPERVKQAIDANAGGFWDDYSTLSTTESTTSSSLVDTNLTASFSTGTYLIRLVGFYDDNLGTSTGNLGASFTGTISRSGVNGNSEGGTFKADSILGKWDAIIYGAQEGMAISASGLAVVSGSGTLTIQISSSSGSVYLRDGSTLYWKKVA